LAARRAWLAPAGVLALVAASLLAAQRLERQLVTGCSDALAGLDQPLTRRGVLMPFQLEVYCGVADDANRSQVPHLQPLTHMAALYTVAQGGFMPYLFVGTGAVHAFTFREPPLPIRMPPSRYFALGSDLTLREDAPRRRELLTQLTALGAQYEAIVAFGATSDDMRYIAARGYQTDFEQGTLLLAHFVPCEVQLLVEPSDERSVELAFGVPGSPALARWSFPLKADEPLRARLPTLCGELWIEAHFAGGWRCEGADESDRLTVTATRQLGLTRCVPRRP
jgi:hypothetical protein